MRGGLGVAGMLAALAVLGATAVRAHPGASARIDDLTHRIEAQPERQDLYILRGAEFARGGAWESAAADFGTARELGGPDAVGFEAGRLHYRKGEYREAHAQFSAYLRHRPDSPRATLHRARAAARMGEVESALADYRRYFRVAKDIHPGDFVAAAKLLAASGGVEDALDLLDTGLERLGPNAQLQRHAVDLETRMGRPERAVARWRRLEPALGRSPAWQVTLAEIHLAADEPRQARAWLDSADARLSALRPTVARGELRDRIAGLLKVIDARQIGSPGPTTSLLSAGASREWFDGQNRPSGERDR